MSEQLIKLRDEILGFEAIIGELQKWKLIAIAAVFVAGLGLSDKTGPNASLVLLAIPVVTFYSDLMIRDYYLRLCLISSFMRSQCTGEFARYEAYIVGLERRGVGLWILEQIAYSFASIIANSAVILIGAFGPIFGLPLRPGTGAFLMIGGFAGIVLSLIVNTLHRRAFQRLMTCASRLAIPPVKNSAAE